MRAFAITHLNYWFRILSILERTKNSTKTSNTSFERSDSGLFKSWRSGAWHSYWPATLTLCDKWNFFGEEGVASPWCCHAPVLHKFYCPLSGLSKKVLLVFLLFLVLSKIDEIKNQYLRCVIARARICMLIDSVVRVRFLADDLPTESEMICQDISAWASM